MDDASIKVLCFFRYWPMYGDYTQQFDDSVMIHVHTREQVEEAFAEAIRRRLHRGWGVGPLPERWELAGWLPEVPLTYAH